jgi:hypothetical protein
MELAKEEHWIKVHPALDFVDDHAYIGIKTHTRAGVKNVLVRDDRVVIDCQLHNLINQNITLEPPKCFNYPKWSEQSANAFAKGTDPVVEPAQLFQDIKTMFTTYIDLDNPKFYDFLALWNIGTYYHQLFDSYPYVFLNGPTESGKSKTLDLCSCISFNGRFSLNMNPVGIFRLVDNSKCTLILDELENLNGRMRNPLFRTMLLGGYKKGGNVQRFMRNENIGEYEPRDYATYSPKMLANIAGMDNVLESRCITIHTQRSYNPAITRITVELDNPVFQQIRDNLFVYMMNSWKEVRQVYKETQEAEGITARAWELWRPILALAKHFGGEDLVNQMKTLALECVAEIELDNADLIENLLVESLLPTITADGYYALSSIKEELVQHLEDGAWVKERYVGRLLRNLGFANKRRRNYGYEYFIEVAKIRQLAQTHGIPLGVDGVGGVDIPGKAKQNAAAEEGN